MQRKISFQVHFGWALTVYILLQKRKGGFFIIFHLLNMEGKGRKTVGNFSQTSFRSGTRPLLSHNALPTIYTSKDTFTIRN